MPDDLLTPETPAEELPTEALAEESPAEEPASVEGEAPEVTEEGEDELVITLGEEEETPDPTSDTPPIRQMRQQLREVTKALRAAEAKLKQAEVSPPVSEEDPGERPKLSDYDFDEERFAEALEGWTAKRAKQQQIREEREKQAKAAQEQWAKRVQQYQTDAKSLKVPDFEDAETAVIGTLSQLQQTLLLKAKKPEILVYALGKSPKRLKELAAINDPVDFVFAVAEVQREIKVNQTKRAPAPEKTVRGGAVGAGAAMIATADLSKLKEKARETGDYSAYFAAKAKLEGKKA